MKKFIGTIVCFISLATHAQFATFTLDSLKGTLNGKEISFPQVKIQHEVTDTSALIILGKNSNNENFGVRFSITKFSTVTGSYYLPDILFVYLDKNNKEQHTPMKTDFSDYTLTANYNSVKMNQLKESFSSPPESYSISYSCLIDGGKLNYTTVRDSNKKPTEVSFNIKQLSINKKAIFKHKKFNISETETAQTLTIGIYNNEPMILTYELLKGQTGSSENFYLKTKLHYVDKVGKVIETNFFKAVFLSSRKSEIYIYPNNSMLSCSYTLKKIE